MDRELEQVIARLEARFDAALAREEEEAAADLAVSLRQDRTLAELAVQATGLRLLNRDGGSTAVTVVGADYCGTGRPLSCVCRLGSDPLLIHGSGVVPERRRDTLQEVARRWAGAGELVRLGLESDEVSGPLTQVGPDNLVLEALAGRLIVPLGLVRSIRLVHED